MKYIYKLFWMKIFICIKSTKDEYMLGSFYEWTKDEYILGSFYAFQRRQHNSICSHEKWFSTFIALERCLPIMYKFWIFLCLRMFCHLIFVALSPLIWFAYYRNVLFSIVRQISANENSHSLHLYGFFTATTIFSN